MSGTGIVAWLAGEVFDLSLGEAVGRLLQSRAAAARDILQDELSRAAIGIADAADKDEAAAMVFEYTEAARQGAARRNLRMLAQILAGALVTAPIYASEFLRWSRILADLTREEIIVLAKLHEVHSMPTMTVGDTKQFQEIDAKMLLDLQAVGVAQSKLEMSMHLGALQRTGLVILHSGYGGSWYVPTPRLDALLALTRLEAVMAEPAR
jgi:hypothetical protein